MSSSKNTVVNTAINKAKQRAVVICPGRGTYNKEELGYLQRLHRDKTEIISLIDDYRDSQGQVKVSELDSMDNYSMRVHTAGENASALIYACALADYQAINRDQFDIVAVTGNSMGWYIALAVAGALAPRQAIALINTMGSMMTDGLVGGQMIYPIINDHWQIDSEKQQQVMQWLAQANQQLILMHDDQPAKTDFDYSLSINGVQNRQTQGVSHGS